MTSSSRFVDYLGVGLAAARPTTPTLAPGCLGIYYATDTTTWSIWTGAAWISPPSLTGTAGGDLSGTFPNPVVAKINQVGLGSTTATTGNLLIANGTIWATQAMSGDITINSTGTTAIGANKVTNAQLAQGAARTVKANSTFAAANETDISEATLAGMVALRGYMNGLELVYNSATVIGFNAGVATSDDNTVMMTLASSYTKTMGSWAVGSTNGCLDTGGVGNAWYYFFLIERTDTGVTDILASLSPTAPTMPTNYTKKRRIGAQICDGSGHFSNTWKQTGGRVTWDVPLSNRTGTLGATTAISQSLATPAAIVTVARLAGFGSDTTAWVLYISPLNTTDEAPDATYITWSGNASGTSVQSGGNINVETASSSGNIRVRGTAATNNLYLTTLGWDDPRA